VHSQEADENVGTNALTQIRLFRADPRLRWTRRVHEQISPACEKLAYPQEFVDIQIHHLGYRDAALMQRKINRDLRLLRMEYATNPQDPGTLLYLGLNLMKTGKNPEALPYLMQAYQVTLNMSQQYVAVILSMLVDCLIRNGQMEHALTISAEAIRRFPRDLGISLQQAMLLFQRRQNTMAIHLLRDCLARPPVRETFFCSQNILNGREIKLLLARIYTDEKSFSDAERLYQELIAAQPSDENLWGYLGALYLTQKRFGDVEHAIRQVEKCPRGQSVAEVLRAAIQLEQNNLAAARQHCDAAILHQPDSGWARALLCQVLYLQRDPQGQLENALRDLLRLDPLNKMANEMLQEVKKNQQMHQSQWSVNVNM
jgi:predicted Zn-dependent protease